MEKMLFYPFLFLCFQGVKKGTLMVHTYLAPVLPKYPLPPGVIVNAFFEFLAKNLEKCKGVCYGCKKIFACIGCIELGLGLGNISNSIFEN